MKLPAGYVWITPRSAEQTWNADPRFDLTSTLLIVGLALVLAIPPVANALGIAPLVAATIVLSYAVHSVLVSPLVRWVGRSPRIFQMRVLIELVHGVAIVSALAAATSDPLTPLWSLNVMYAALDGGDYGTPPSVMQVVTHAVGPLLALPIFLAAHVPWPLAVGVPLLVATFTSFAYGYMARRAVTVRTSFAEGDAVRARVAEERRASERSEVVRHLSGLIDEELRAARTNSTGAPDAATASRRGLAELRKTMVALEAPAPPSPPAKHGPLYRRTPTFVNAEVRRSWFTGRVGLSFAIAAPIGLATTIPIANGDPTSALWVFSVLYATVDGSDYEVEASWLQVALHCGAPLVTIPIFVALGAPLGSAIGGTVFVASACFMAFHYTATRARVVREALSERTRLEAELERLRTDRERERLARDLHDTVGANLSLAALYADLLAQHEGDPEIADRFSTARDDATSQSLDDLRGLMEVLASEALDLTSLADVLRARAAQIASTSGVTIDVRTNGDATLDAATHYALVRIAHEATSNAIRHGHAPRVDIELLAEANDIVLRVSDDGGGFDTRAMTHGRGLPNMRARVAELGGSIDVASDANGTRITAHVPLRRT